MWNDVSEAAFRLGILLFIVLSLLLAMAIAVSLFENDGHDFHDICDTPQGAH